MQKRINPENLLINKYPAVAKMYDTKKNSIPLELITTGMHAKAWFTCPKCGASYYCKITTMLTDAEHCPECRKHKLRSVKHGHSIADHADIMLDWDYEHNIYKPEEISECSNRMITWKCHTCGHIWKAKPSLRVSNHAGCRECGNRHQSETKRLRYAKENGSLAEKRPDLLREWDYDKNTLKPDEVALKSNFYAWWKCPLGHSYKALIANRTNLGRGCPYCAGKKLLVGFNDLQAKHPDIAKEWDMERNYPITPSNVMSGTHHKYYFLCPKGHSYLCSVANRTAGVSGCPYCAHQRTVPEYIILYYLDKYHIIFISPYNASWLSRGSYDIYIPSYTLIIEYDGARYHGAKVQWDTQKTQDAVSHHMRVIRVREYGLPEIHGCVNIMLANKRGHDAKYTNMEPAIRYILTQCKIDDADVDINRDIRDILEKYKRGAY